jgi:hypothetical protein
VVPQELHLHLHLQLLAIDEEWLRLFWNWKGMWSPLYGMAPVVGDFDEEQQQQELQNSSVVAAVWLLLPSRFLCSEIEGLTVRRRCLFVVALSCFGRQQPVLSGPPARCYFSVFLAVCYRDIDESS